MCIKNIAVSLKWCESFRARRHPHQAREASQPMGARCFRCAAVVGLLVASAGAAVRGEEGVGENEMGNDPTEKECAKLYAKIIGMAFDNKDKRSKLKTEHADAPNFIKNWAFRKIDRTEKKMERMISKGSDCEQIRLLESQISG
jgi:hypothetical protein